MALSAKAKPTKSRPSYGRDPTIYDYANSSKCSNRTPKASGKIMLTTIELESEAAADDHSDHADGGDDKVRRGKTRLTGDAVHPSPVYNDYHIDLWFLVSEFILPEDVCRFALICRKTAEVVQSGRFWTQLYRSYYDSSIEMPPRFQPDSMVRLRGLRSAVIRSMYYLYPPFVNRLTASAYRNPFVDRIVRRQLLSVWHKRTKNCWTYYFRLKASFLPGSRPAKSVQLQRKKSSLAFMQDIYMNPEEGCQILILTTDYLKVIPMYNETLFVKNLKQTLSHSMMRYKVHLELGNYCGKRCDELVFDSVRNVNVLDWWVPEYYNEISSLTPTDGSSTNETERTDDSDWDN